MRTLILSLLLLSCSRHDSGATGLDISADNQYSSGHITIPLTFTGANKTIQFRLRCDAAGGTPTNATCSSQGVANLFSTGSPNMFGSIAGGNISANSTNCGWSIPKTFTYSV